LIIIFGFLHGRVDEISCVGANLNFLLIREIRKLFYVKEFLPDVRFDVLII